MMGYYGGWGWGIGGLFLLMVMLVALVAFVLFTVWAVRALFPAGRQSGREAAQEILQRRLAGGEISQAEYEQANRAVGNAAPGAH